MTVRRGLVAALLAVVVLAAGCGYSLRGTLPPHVKSIAVPIFHNRTQEPAVESFITRAIVEAFATNGRLRVVRPEDADAILNGEIVVYDVTGIAFNHDANIRVYRLTVTMNLTLRDTRDNAVLFQQTGVTEKADFRVLGAVSQTIAREETALRQAAVEVARAVVNLAIDRF